MLRKKAFSGISLFFALVFMGASLAVRADELETNLPPKKQILFVCTGNFYRSRFAEALFNEKAGEAHLNWQAYSRGLQLASSQHGISPYSRQELIKRGVPKSYWSGVPKPLTREDLEKSDCIVLMDEAEHRPLLEKKFPVRDDRKIHYWHIAEAWKVKPAISCQAMTKNVEQLLATLPR